MKRLFQFWSFFCLTGLGLIGLSLTPLRAQTPILTGAGYGAPTPLVVAPGQIIKLYVSGTPTVLPAQTPAIQATTVPLPTMLGGFSVAMRQGSSSYAVPLFSVEQVANCTDAGAPTPQCITTILMVQIPVEITPVIYLANPSQSPSDLSVDDNGTVSAHFAVVPLADNIHVLTICDLPQNQGLSSLLPSPCPAIVTHANGTMVSQLSPALGGETVVIYAYGLGPTRPTVESGNATPAGLSPFFGSGFGIQFDFRQNAGAAIPSWTVGMVNGVKVANRAPAPPFAGLTPGQVGLYQINVTIPNPVPPVLPCPTAFVGVGPLVGSFIQTNLTIDISGVSSFDGAAICVQPPV